MTASWYAAGLRFSCLLECGGKCCTGPEEGVVYVNAAERRAMARLLGISLASATTASRLPAG